MSTNRTIKITGPFTDDEVRQFIRLLRAIDEARPGEHFVAGITDPDEHQTLDGWRSGNAAVCKTATEGVRLPRRPPYETAVYRSGQ